MGSKKRVRSVSEARAGEQFAGRGTNRSFQHDSSRQGNLGALPNRRPPLSRWSPVAACSFRHDCRTCGRRRRGRRPDGRSRRHGSRTYVAAVLRRPRRRKRSDADARPAERRQSTTARKAAEPPARQQTGRRMPSDPIPVRNEVRCRGAGRHLRRQEPRSIRRARCSRSVASNTRPAYTTRAAPSSVQLNPLLPGLAVYGDWRTAVAYNQNNGKDIAQIATRLNLDVDFKITGTERIHAFFTPIQEDNQIHPLRVRRRRRRWQVQRRVRPRPADAVLRG